MPSVCEVKTEHRVAWLAQRVKHRRVGAGARIGLDVGVIGTEQRLRAFDRQALDLVDPFAGVVLTVARIAVRVLRRQDRPLCLENCAWRHALGRDQVERGPLSGELTVDCGAHLRVDDLEGRLQWAIGLVWLH